VSARTLAGTHRQHCQTARRLVMKIGEVICTAEPKLSSQFQADAAYFIGYVRSGNLGSGQSRGAETKQKNAGLP
jgi:hypothetical protein